MGHFTTYFTCLPRHDGPPLGLARKYERKYPEEFVLTPKNDKESKEPETNEDAAPGAEEFAASADEIEIVDEPPGTFLPHTLSCLQEALPGYFRCSSEEAI